MRDNKIVILDFGSQYTQLIAKLIRKKRVPSYVFPCHLGFDALQQENPQAIILSGGPSSVYSKKKPVFDERIMNLPLPILGICYGYHLLVRHFGGEIIVSQRSEYGREKIKIVASALLLNGLGKTTDVWMSHGDEVKSLSNDFQVLASTKNALAAIKHKEKPIYGVQFHPEVSHTLKGEVVIDNFLFKVVKAKKTWSIPNFVKENTSLIKEKVGDKKVLLALSGGVDSMVLAMLLHRALGDRLSCVFIDNGLLREGEGREVVENFRRNLKAPLKVINARKVFLRNLRLVRDPEKKRKIIGAIFLKIFLKILKSHDFLAQGTLYPDVIESTSVFGPSVKIKTHHNLVKGILKLKKREKLIEPFAFLFKDEVRKIGELLGLDERVIQRQPFPGPGLAIRILGRITPYRLHILRKADEILLEEVKKLPIRDQLWQSFAVLLPIRSVGVAGDKRVYGYTIVLRLVSSKNGMTADFELLGKAALNKIANRITGEVDSICRVVLDITSKPPATIEWE